MGNHGAEARILQRRAGADAGHHVVRAALVGGFAVGHRADDRDFVGNLRGLLHQLGEVNALELGLDGAHRSAILDGGIHLRVEGLLMRHAAGQVDVDDVLGLAFLGGRRFVSLRLERVAERQPERAERADLQEVAAGGVERVVSRVAPSGFLIAHMLKVIRDSGVDGKGQGHYSKAIRNS